MSDIETAIWTIRQAADNEPNIVDYPVSNMLTLIDNLMIGAVPDELAREIQDVTGEWVKELFNEEGE